MPKQIPQPFEPADYDNSTIAAARAVAGGSANEGQQKLFFKWLVETVSGYYDLSFRPGGDDGRRLSDFAEGRRYVGAQCLKMLRPELTPKPPVIKEK